eukprot:1939836-Rhodomonas_salina.1
MSELMVLILGLFGASRTVYFFLPAASSWAASVMVATAGTTYCFISSPYSAWVQHSPNQHRKSAEKSAFPPKPNIFSVQIGPEMRSVVFDFAGFVQDQGKDDATSSAGVLGGAVCLEAHSLCT